MLCAKLPVVKVVPAPRVREPPIDKPVVALVDTVPLKVRSPAIDVVPDWRVFTPLPDKVR
jgi:hypothetical protein